MFVKLTKNKQSKWKFCTDTNCYDDFPKKHCDKGDTIYKEYVWYYVDEILDQSGMSLFWKENHENTSP